MPPVLWLRPGAPCGHSEGARDPQPLRLLRMGRGSVHPGHAVRPQGACTPACATCAKREVSGSLDGAAR